MYGETTRASGTLPEDAEELIDVAFPSEERSFVRHFYAKRDRERREHSETGEQTRPPWHNQIALSMRSTCDDTADGPHVNVTIVTALTQHDFRCTIPTRDHFHGQWTCEGREPSGQAKVRDLQLSTIRDQDIVGLQVSVHDTHGMTVC